MSESIQSSNYELYRVFYYAASYKSLTKAAAALGVSQPAISQSLKQLEAMLGVKLTARTGHGIKLTPEGEVLFPYVEKGCLSFDAAENALSDFLKGNPVSLPQKSKKSTAPSPVVKKAAPKKMAKEVKPEVEKAISSAKSAADKITVSKSTSQSYNTTATDAANKASVLNNAEASEKPVAVSGDASKVPVSAKAPVSSQLYFVTGTQYRHFAGQKLPFRILEHLPVVLPGYGDKSRTAIDAFLKGKGIKIYPDKEFYSYPDVIDSVAHNEGISCLPEEFILPYLEAGKVFKLEFEEALPEVEV